MHPSHTIHRLAHLELCVRTTLETQSFLQDETVKPFLQCQYVQTVEDTPILWR